jgi:glycosyltransferase involved in cell wall biosynthesis
VNSKFVRETCILAGYPASRIFVVYLGIDDKYKATLTESRQQNDLPINRSLLYVGGWQRRKGVETLVDALNSLSPSINIEIAGGIEPDLRNSIKHCKFFAQSTTTYHGIIPRNQLSALFSKHTIFVFPSYCEGSARVIFEAMAAGCYIITTPNSGSIVEDGIHGAIVSPGDSLSLQKAIQFALDNPALVAAIGAENSHIVRNQYSQLDYMQNVLRVYHRILGR